ncbi:MAG: hypothetical protein ABMA13_05230 [Chthoniobacteraceae bacterium]
MSDSTSTAPSDSHRRHVNRKARARFQLASVILLLCANFALLFFLSMSEPDGRPVVGVLFGGAISSALLLGAIWNRQDWARYVLVILLVLLAGYFGFRMLMALNDPERAGTPAVRLVGLGIAGFLGAGAWLIFSRRLRYLTTPPGSGG